MQHQTGGSSSSYSSVPAEASFSGQPAAQTCTAAAADGGEQKDNGSSRKWGGCLPSSAAAAAACFVCPATKSEKGQQASAQQQRAEKARCSKRKMCGLLLLVLVLAGVGTGVGVWASNQKAKKQVQQQQPGFATGGLADVVAATRDADVPPAGSSSSSSKERLNFQVVVTLPASSAQKGCTTWFDSKEVSMHTGAAAAAHNKAHWHCAMSIRSLGDMCHVNSGHQTVIRKFECVCCMVCCAVRTSSAAGERASLQDRQQLLCSRLEHTFQCCSSTIYALPNSWQNEASGSAPCVDQT
jgi:hypothetical protein